ncbi:phage tail protein [Burkholderia arboris]|uniref:phage tail protein n=1 Tax=Burkholderia arboris TaxID=488730 RepID=UPI001CA3B017|nr:phage tail protein [Burkholderia arboris]MBY8605252.1 phage tail protein [Burkholderia arboris]
MGQSLGLVLGVAGAVVGGIATGGTSWAIQAGFLAGGLLGAILTPHKLPQLPDIRVQDAAYGKYIPRLYGKYRLSGNVIWTGPAHEHSQSGKGMGGKGNQPYVTMSLAVGLCAGPITAVTRIWANGKLIYDITNPSNFQAISGSAQMVTNFTVYPGDENQLPDPIIQSYEGAGNVPGHRGLAYVVFNELNLQNWGNYVPSLSFEVVKSGAPTYVLSGAQSVPPSPAMVPALVGNVTRNIGSYIDNAGNVWGWQYGLSQPSATSNTAQPFKLTPYGVEWMAPPVNIGLSFPVSNGHCQDDQGILCTDGLFRQNNGAVWNTGLPLGLITTPTYIKAGGKIYITNQVGNTTGPLYISTPVVQASTTPPTIVTGAYAGDSLYLLGVTANYIYAVSIYGANQYCLLRLDMQGNLVSVLDGPSFAKYSSLSCGQVVNDNLIYINGQNGHIWVWSGSGSAIDTGMTGSQSGNQSLLNVISQGNIAYFSDFAFGYTFGAQVLNANAADLSLASVVAAECQYAGLQSSQYDTTQLTDQILGYAITGNSSPRDALAPLMSTYFFDACDTGGPLKFVRRGGTPVMTIPWGDLGADSDSQSHTALNPLQETITQEFDLPRQVTLTYASANADYNPGLQPETMPQTTSNLDEPINVPIVLADNDAKARVQTMLWERWIKRRSFQFSLQLKYLALEPGDVVTVINQFGTSIDLRVTKITNDGKGSLNVSADPSVPQIYPNPATYVAQGGVSAGFTKQSVPYNGSTILRLLDVPPLRDQDTTAALYLAACGFNSAWPGAAVDISRDDVNFSQITSVTGQAAIGLTVNALGNYTGGNFPDEGNALQVQLYNASQSLSSVPYASFLNGANAALVGGELIFFRTATQTGAGAYTLTGLVRGVKGTGAAIGNHTSGETFVLLDATKLVQVGINLTDIGQPLYFEPFLLNVFGNTPGSITQVTPVRARVKPLAPHLLAAGKGSASGAAGDVTLKWIRRARVNTTWISGTDVPLDESAETYNVTVLNAAGASVRQLTVSGPFTAPAQPTWVYAAAQIATDGFTTGNTITFQVYQNSDQGVPGYVSTTSIEL